MLGDVPDLPSSLRRAYRMGMPAPLYYTADMVRALPDDGNRYELVYGELLVSPSPRLWHQALVGRLFLALGNYLRSHPVGLVMMSPADISWASDVLVQPDVFVAPLAQVRTLDWTAVQDLLLVVEVLSPSTARNDRFTKRRRYQEAGVALYWIVDGEARQVEVWTPTESFPRIERERLVWEPAGAGEPFSLELAELFGPV